MIYTNFTKTEKSLSKKERLLFCFVQFLVTACRDLSLLNYSGLPVLSASHIMIELSLQYLMIMNMNDIIPYDTNMLILFLNILLFFFPLFTLFDITLVGFVREFLYLGFTVAFFFTDLIIFRGVGKGPKH
jgi:hypothetical protein